MAGATVGEAHAATAAAHSLQGEGQCARIGWATLHGSALAARVQGCGQASAGFFMPQLNMAAPTCTWRVEH